nr:MAG TPA: hypothetical protein [Caudoviricetes sp.]
MRSKRFSRCRMINYTTDNGEPLGEGFHKK